MTKGIKRAVVILATIMIFLLTAAILLFFPVQTAFAARGADDTDWVIIDEIYDDENSIFKAEELTKLYSALAGVDNLEALASKVSAENPLTSENFRTQNGGTKNVSVWFGGKKWDAVYLTKDRTGNVVLDLWQSADNISETPSKYANRETTASDNPTDAYPNNMYSTSLIRVQTLNNGGYMSISGSELAEKTEQSASNEYVRFTMSSTDNSLVKYIVQPKNIAYQETENNIGMSGWPYTCPNGAYGTPSEVKWGSSGRYNYAAQDDNRAEGVKYGEWQNDYLWIPSIAETGNSNNADNQNGLWETDASLRSTVSKNSINYAWTRSGVYNYSKSVLRLYTSGEGLGDYVYNRYLVRPALHLNLTKANASIAETVTAGWESLAPKTFYTTGENLFTDIASYIEVKTESGTTLDKSNYTVSVDGSSNQIITAGSYTLKITLNSDDYQFADGTNSATLTAKVEEAKVRVTQLVNDHSYVYGFGSFDDAWMGNYGAHYLPTGKITITLYAEESYDGASFVINTGMNIDLDYTLDLNGHSLTLVEYPIDVINGKFTLTDSAIGGKGKLNGNIDVNGGSFIWSGGGINTVSLNDGNYINVQSPFTAPADKIAIKVDNFDTPYKVLSWTGDDPTANFKSSDENACFYKGMGENAAYIGKHSFVFEGKPSWTESSATFTGIKCEHCGTTASATVTAEVEKVSASCTTENITYTAKVNLSDLKPAFDSYHAAIKGGTITKTKTVSGSKKETPTHEWEYSAGADGKLTATCKHTHTAESDGKQTFTVTVTVPQNATYNGATHPATTSGDTAGFPGGYSVTYKYKGFSGADYQAHGDPQEAGYYQVIIAASSQSATLTFEIKKATITLKWEAEDSYTYTGSAQIAPTASIESGNYDGGDLTVSSAIADDSEMKGSFMNAGKYTFAATLGGAAAGNYELSQRLRSSLPKYIKQNLQSPRPRARQPLRELTAARPTKSRLRTLTIK